MHKDSPLFYITNDPLRGLGMEEVYPDFHLVCVDFTPIVDLLIQKGIRVFCLEKEYGKEFVRNSRETILLPEVQDYLLKNSRKELGLVFFRPVAPVHRLLHGTNLGQSRQINIYNADLVVSNKLENKIEFFNLCQECGLPQAPGLTGNISRLNYDNLTHQFGPMIVVQFERGWFGNSTYFISTAEEYSRLVTKFPDRMIKVSTFISGKVVTNNVVVSNQAIFQTKPFLQLNDESGQSNKLARLPGSTIGNVWFTEGDFPIEDYSSAREKVYNYTKILGQKVQSYGFRGFCGFDFLVDEQSNVFIQECNSRFTASTQMITQLEREVCGISLLDLHFKVFDQTQIILNQNDADVCFQDLQGCRVVARNAIDSSITIREFPNGVYSQDERKFKKQGYQLSDITESEMLLFTTSPNRKINPDQEIVQIQQKNTNYHEAIQNVRTIKKDLCE